jgi:oxygen-independent coproporphyrinogen-3 oxidase
MSKAKHLYIHIPFCNRICNYCDFVRSVACKKTKVEYVANIINQLNDLKNLKLKTLYIGGGTPNSLDYNTLKKLLKNCSLFLTKNTEFSIECNPKFVNKKQVALFKKYGINRISLGVQTLNENILREMNREQNNNDVIKAIKIFRKIGINNISCDFIYGFNNTTLNDIKNILIFINKYKIKHLSFYALEVKENSILAKNNYQLDNDKMDGELRLILKGLEKYQHYEISS